MSESVYRLLVLACFLVFMGVRLNHARRLSGDESGSRPGVESRVLMLVDRSFILINTLVVLIFVVYPPLISAFAVALPDAVRLAGVGVSLWGIVLFSRSLSTLGRHATLSLAIRDDHRLVTEGPYRWVRHPMYTAFCFIFGGFFLQTANWLVGLNALLGYGIVKMMVRTPREEQMLLDEFGDEYRDYMGRTARFVGIGPRLRARAGRN